MKTRPLGNTGLTVPPIIFGSSCLGNLYQALAYETKLETVREMFRHVSGPVVLDSAGKYGAGLALEMIGRCLRDVGVSAGDVVISNKLGWQRVPLTGPEPTFEPGAWIGIEHDARQTIGCRGIVDCYEQGCELLGAPYSPQLVSVHDPDEYLAAAAGPEDRRRRWQDILAAYGALAELKAAGKVEAVGVGSKDWTVIRDLTDAVDLDWVMLACSLTLYCHPPELLAYLQSLQRRGVGIVNSAVFNAGFLIGGRYFDYRIPDATAPDDQPLFSWRDRFLGQCRDHGVSPAAACVQFGLRAPGVAAVALNTSKPERIAENVKLVTAQIPSDFWGDLKRAELIAPHCAFIGSS